MPDSEVKLSTEALQRAQQVAKGVLAQVSADQMAQQTPCRAWKVSDLVDHMVGSQHWGVATLKGEPPSQSGEGASQGDFAAAYDAAASAAAEAFGADGALDGTVNLGAEMPASALVGILATDTFTHAWDLAKATGQDTDLDPELAEQLLAASKEAIQPSFRSEEGAIFGFEQEAPEGASAADRLAAFLGRQV